MLPLSGQDPKSQEFFPPDSPKKVKSHLSQSHDVSVSTFQKWLGNSTLFKNAADLPKVVNQFC